MPLNSYKRYYETFDFSEGRRFPEEDAIFQLNNDLLHLVDDVVALHDKSKQFISHPVTTWRNCYHLSRFLLDAKTLESHLVSNFTKLEQYWFYYRSRVHPGRRESFVKFIETTGHPVSFENVTTLVRAHWTNLKNLAARIQSMLPQEDKELPDSQQDTNSIFLSLQQKMKELEQTALFLQRHSTSDMRKLESRMEKLENELNNAHSIARKMEMSTDYENDTLEQNRVAVSRNNADNLEAHQENGAITKQDTSDRNGFQTAKNNKRMLDNIIQTQQEEPVFKTKKSNTEERIIFKVSTKPSYLLNFNANHIQNCAFKPIRSTQRVQPTVIFIPLNEKPNGDGKQKEDSPKDRLPANSKNGVIKERYL